MRFVRSLVAVGLVSLAFGAGCAAQSEDVTSGGDAVTSTDAAMSVEGRVDPKAGEANVTIKMTLRGTTVAAVREKLADTQLTMWKGLTRPSVITIDGQSFRPNGAGSPLFSEMSRSGQTVDAYMPFSDSGLAKYAGLNMKLSYELKDAPGSFSLSVKNPETIMTRQVDIDVIAPNQLSFDVKATEAGSDVNLEIQESVAILKRPEAVGKLLGFAFATAEAFAGMSQAAFCPTALCGPGTTCSEQSRSCEQDPAPAEPPRS